MRKWISKKKDDFVIETAVCTVALKNGVPRGFYYVLDADSDLIMKHANEIFLSRFGRAMDDSEICFVEDLYNQCEGKPAIAFFSLLEQWIYWHKFDTDKFLEAVSDR
jgi:hypothetical protein